MKQFIPALAIVLTLVCGVVGFLACSVLWGHNRRRHDPNGFLYAWSTIFFAGVALLAVQFWLGSHSLLPMPDIDNFPAIITTPIGIWLLVCITGVVTAKALQVEKEENRHKRDSLQWFRQHGLRATTPLLLLGLLIVMSGCKAAQLRTAPEITAEAATYTAVAPNYLRLVKASNDTADAKARAVRTVETWYARLIQELQGVPDYGNLTPNLDVIRSSYPAGFAPVDASSPISPNP